MLSGHVAVLVKDDERTRVLDARTLTTVRETYLFSGGVETTGAGPVVASADGRVIVARGNWDNDGDIVLAVAGSPEVVVVQVTDAHVTSLALTPDGGLLLTASARQIRMWARADRPAWSPRSNAPRPSSRSKYPPTGAQPSPSSGTVTSSAGNWTGTTGRAPRTRRIGFAEEGRPASQHNRQADTQRPFMAAYRSLWLVVAVCRHMRRGSV